MPFLQLTGGTICIGMLLATGAAIACPERKVIGLQADGRRMCNVQALWTQACERLDLETIIFANRRYNSLYSGLENAGVSAPCRNARRMLDLNDTYRDWVSVAKGMGVEAAKAETVA